MLGPLYLAVSAIPLAVFVAYPYLKRITPLCHFGVGLALALAPLAGWAVAHPDLARPGPAIALSLFALAWVSGFDIIYATLDEEFDRAHGVHSMVVRLGRERALGLSWALHLVAIVALVAVLVLVTRGPITPERYLWVGVTGALLGITVGLLRMEQKWAEDVNLAFFKVNVWVGAAVLAMVLTARMWAGGF
jgi:4-hydroxybenzoate polyprenyltransferase